MILAKKHIYLQSGYKINPHGQSRIGDYQNVYSNYCPREIRHNLVHRVKGNPPIEAVTLDPWKIGGKNEDGFLPGNSSVQNHKSILFPTQTEFLFPCGRACKYQAGVTVGRRKICKSPCNRSPLSLLLYADCGLMVVHSVIVTTLYMEFTRPCGSIRWPWFRGAQVFMKEPADASERNASDGRKETRRFQCRCNEEQADTFGDKTMRNLSRCSSVPQPYWLNRSHPSSTYRRHKLIRWRLNVTRLFVL